MKHYSRRPNVSRIPSNMIRGEATKKWTLFVEARLQDKMRKASASEHLSGKRMDTKVPLGRFFLSNVQSESPESYQRQTAHSDHLQSCPDFGRPRACLTHTAKGTCQKHAPTAWQINDNFVTDSMQNILLV